MATQNSVWIVISCDAAADRVRTLLDRGFFSEAEQLSNSIKSFSSKVSKDAEAKGGHLYVTLYERIVMEVPLTYAEELPNVIEGFKEVVGAAVAAGLGMTFEEATMAARKSTETGDIELYDPDDAANTKPDYFKTDPQQYEIPPNLFDLTSPPSPAPEPQKPIPREKPAAIKPGIEQEIQLETKYVQAYAQTMGAPSPEEMQQQVEAQKAAMGQTEGLPPELQAALAGQSEESDEDGGDKGSKKDSKGKKSGDKGSKKDSSDEEDEDSEEGDEDDSEASDKLADLLLRAKEHIPDIMKLKEKDPKAFDQAIKLIQKLADVTRSRKKVSKAEATSEVEEFNKAFNAAIGRGWPVGTRKGNKQKVTVNGKAVWRSMASGRVQDAKGQAISVKSHNAAASKGTQAEQ